MMSLLHNVTSQKERKLDTSTSNSSRNSAEHFALGHLPKSYYSITNCVNERGLRRQEEKPGSIPSVFGESAGANMVTYRITTLLAKEEITKSDHT